MSEIKKETKIILTEKGDYLCLSYWIPKAPKALLFISHGFGEHLEYYYDEIAESLCRKGLSVFGHDHLGHGKSSGPRAQIENLSQYTEYVLSRCTEEQKSKEEIPLFMLGHSMGALILLSSLQRAQEISVKVSGVILMGPLIELDAKFASAPLKFLAKIAYWLAPNFQVSGISSELVTKDEIKRKYLENDAFHWHGGMKAGISNVLLNELSEIRETFPNFDFPVLLQHGEKDEIVKPSGSQYFFDTISSKDKEIKFYKDAAHHLYIERLSIRTEAIEDVWEWISSRL